MNYSNLLESIKKIMKSQGRTYRSLASELRISEPTVKRLFAQKSVSLERFAQICQVLGVSFLDVARLAEPHDTEQELHLSYEQEEFLCGDEMIFVLFNLLRKNWTTAQIKRKFRFDDAELTRALVKLDQQKLIELHPHDKVRLLAPSQVDWLTDGPVRRMYEEQIREDFFKHPFLEKSDRLKFLTCEVSQPTMRLILKKMDRLSAEISELVAADEQVPKRESENMAFLLGARAWVLPAMLKYQT